MQYIYFKFDTDFLLLLFMPNCQINKQPYVEREMKEIL